MLRKLWTDDAGVVSLEYLLLSVVVGLGMAVGTSAVSDALNAEYVELGQAILVLNDSYFSNSQLCAGVFGGVGAKGGTLVLDVNGAETYAHDSFVLTTNAGVSNATP
jgi:Flp pilus assembly pilin Flp